MSDFERIISDSMQAFADYNSFDHDDGLTMDDTSEWIDDNEWIDTDDTWLDDFQGEEDFA